MVLRTCTGGCPPSALVEVCTGNPGTPTAVRPVWESERTSPPETLGGPPGPLGVPRPLRHEAISSALPITDRQVRDSGRGPFPAPDPCAGHRRREGAENLAQRWYVRQQPRRRCQDTDHLPEPPGHGDGDVGDRTRRPHQFPGAAAQRRPRVVAQPARLRAGVREPLSSPAPSARSNCGRARSPGPSRGGIRLRSRSATTRRAHPRYDRRRSESRSSGRMLTIPPPGAGNKGDGRAKTSTVIWRCRLSRPATPRPHMDDSRGVRRYRVAPRTQNDEVSGR